MIRHSLDFAEFNPRRGKSLVWGYPYAYRSAFLNQYFEEAVRTAHEDGRGVLYRASEFANYRVLRRARESLGLEDERGFLDYAETLFMSLGYGRILVENDNLKLIASPIAQTYLYVHHTPSESPMCDFQRGFAAATLSVALNQPPGKVFVEETECVAMHDPVCRMVPRVEKAEYGFPEVDYDRLNYYEEDVPDFMERIGMLKRAIPTADDTGNIYIQSAYGGLKRAAYLYFPADYFSYATWKVLEEGDFNTADLMLRFTGYAGFLMTFVSLYYTPIGKVAYGNPQTPEEIFTAIMGSMKYWGMGHWKVSEVREGRVVAKVHNFYENDFQRLVGVEEPYSPYVVGGVMGLLYAVYTVRFYLKDEPLFIRDAVQSYDDAVNTFRVKSSFDHRENAQTVEVEW